MRLFLVVTLLLSCLLSLPLQAEDKYTELHRAKTQIDLAEKARKDTDYERAIEFYERALAICKRHRGGTSSIPNIYFQLGSIALDLGDHRQAMDYLNLGYQASESIDKGGAGTGAILAKQGRIALLSGDPESAERLATSALDIMQEKLPGSKSEADVWTLLSDIHVDAQSYDKAESFLVKKITIQNSKNPRGLNVAHTLDRLGWITMKAEAYDRAHSYFEKSLELRREVAGDSLPVAISYNKLGSLEVERSRYDEAMEHFEKANKILSEIAPFTLELAESFHYLGHLENLREKYSRADSHLQKALEIRRELAPDTYKLGDTLVQLSVASCGQKEWKMARQYNEHAMKILEWRLGSSPHDREMVLEKLMPVYRLEVMALIQDGRERHAFEALEYARDREFAENCLIFGGYSELGKPDDFLKEERLARRDFHKTLGQLQQWKWPRHKEHIQFLQKYNARLLQEHQERIAAFHREKPLHADYFYPSRISLSDLQDVLPDGAVYLTWSVQDDVTYLFALTSKRREFHVHRLSVGREAITAMVHDFRKQIALVRADGSTPADLREKSAELYDALLGPAKDLLAENISLVISPDDAMQLLPFDALLADKRDTGSYLVNDFYLHYAVSVRRYLATATSDESNDSGHPLTLIAPFAPKGSSPLFGTETDRDALLSIYESGKSYSGNKVSTKLIRHLGPRSRNLVLAARVYNPRDKPLDAGFNLAPEGSDKVFVPKTLLEERGFNPVLLHLPGCDTGSDAGLDATSFRSILDVLQSVGSRQIVISLWPNVSDDSRSMMVYFYQLLAQGETLHGALSTAQRSAAENSDVSEDDVAEDEEIVEDEPVMPHPYFWAGKRLYAPAR